MGYYSVTLVSPHGDELNLMKSRGYTVTKVEGMEPPKATINTSGNALRDGATFNSAKLGVRNIVIELTFEEPVERNRIALYDFVKVKSKHTIRLTNGERDVTIEGYCESIEIGYFDEREGAQISFICPRPYLTAAAETHIMFSSTEGLFEFPFSITAEGTEFGYRLLADEVPIYNGGDLATGFVATITATGTCINPTIYNTETGGYMKFEITLQAGDVLTVSTITGEKYVELLSGGTRTNALNSLDKTSEWLVLEDGDNIYLITAEQYPENISTEIEFYAIYEGM